MKNMSIRPDPIDPADISYFLLFDGVSATSN